MTAAEIEMRRDIRGKKKAKLLSLFEKLELRYTKTRVYKRYEAYKTVARYTVLAKDANSVVTISEISLTGKRIVHIHFEGDHYWISLGRINEIVWAHTEKASAV